MENLEEAVEILKRGGVIGFPTDTVYGIGCSAFNEKAVEHIYKIKERSFEKPLPIILSSIEDIPLYTKNISEEAWSIIKKYLPGPLTVILEKTDLVSDIVTAGQPNVAIRVANLPIVVEIIKKVGCPLIATSANKSGEKEAVTADEVKRNLGSLVDFIIDGGRCVVGISSTVVDLTVAPFKIIRHGSCKFSPTYSDI